ncbi:MAG TPA: hypothetical protein VK437_02170, partial [Steroidobacteraceae bacterium]|nr:hypothetical protein [Steroidobacteraceae bacterium]
KIEHAVMRLSIAGASLIIVVLLAVYRSAAALLLGLLPVATGALVGVAAVALAFPAVHGITLGFGITLIGESVDYSIYFFIQSLRVAAPWHERVWPTMRLGMLTSVCGFASLLPSGFPGLAQLGAYSVSGLIAAALVTRFVLPELLPRGFTIRDLKPAGEHIARLLGVLRRQRQSVLWGLALGILCAALLVLYGARGSLWNRELASLSPIPLPMQRQDAKLRGELGAPNALDLVVVSGNTLESVLQEAERAGQALEPLIDQKVIAGFDSPANYLPSIDTQAARRASLPDPERLRDDLERATAGLALDASRLRPFLDDVEAARHGPWVTAQDLKGTSLGAGFDALILRGPDGWNALLPLRTADSARPDIDDTRVESALARAHLQGTQLLDLKRESDALYTDYLHEAVRLSSAGFLAIVVLLGLALHSASRASRVLAPLVLAVLTVAAALAACRVQLTILHLVGMLLIVAVGSNYALFFDRLDRAGGADSMTLASLGVANLCTVIGFGLLSFSGVPVLEALGTTVAPGAFLALAFASVLTPRA